VNAVAPALTLPANISQFSSSAASAELSAPAIKPLIERIVKLVSNEPDLAVIRVDYPMRYDLCERIKRKDWESMTLAEEDALEEFYSLNDCPGITERLLPEVNQVVRKIAARLGNSNPDRFSAQITGGPMSTNIFDQISLPRKDAFSLIRSRDPVAKRKIAGLIAVQIAHRILNHVEQIFARLFTSNGFLVQSLEDVTGFMVARASGFTMSPFTRSGNRIVERFLGVARKRDREAVLQDMVQVSEMKNPELSTYELYRKFAKEADLYTLNDSYLARGVRDYLDSEINRLATVCQKQPALPACATLHQNSPTHPPLTVRRDYMTQALCEKHPTDNPDLCVFNARPVLHLRLVIA